MISLTALLILSLATWRVATLFVNERGPWDIALRLRKRLGFVYYEDGSLASEPESMPGAILSCVWCSAFWLSGPMLALGLALPLLVTGIAVAAGAVLVELAAGRLQRNGDG